MSRIFLVSFCFLFLAFNSKLLAQENNPYLVDKVVVNVSGKSPSDARNQAVATARRDAFLVLLTRLEKNLSIANIISNDEISDMVMSEQVDGEKIAGNSYFASFNILFAKDFVDHILSKKNLANVVPQNIENSLVIPVKKTYDQSMNEKTLLWEEDNDWKMAIVKNVDAKRTSLESKLIVPDADIENLTVLSRDNISSVNFGAFEPMFERYNAKKAYILFFSQNLIENKILVDVIAINRVQRKQFKLSFVNANSGQYAAVMERVAAKTVEYLASMQKSEQQAGSTLIKIQVNFGSLEKWLELKNKIENSGLGTDFVVDSIARDHANVMMQYPNSQIGVGEAFSKIGISAEQKGENFYVVF